MATLAPALATLRAQIDAKFPGRSKLSDGWIGDAAHASRGSAAASQHNPNEYGVVCAIDVTHDPANGMDARQLMEELDASNDPRIFYLIHNYQIDNSDDSRTPYYGSNPHTKHIHISTWFDRPSVYNQPHAWNIPMLGGAPAPSGGGGGIVWEKTRYTGPLGSRTVSLGSIGDDVAFIQRWHGLSPADGEFGPATDKAVRATQLRNGLVVDGVVGSFTWKVMGIGGAAPAPAPAPVPALPKLPGIPVWDIPIGQYLGNIKGGTASRGGGAALERDNVLWWQRMLVASGCVAGQKDWRSGWSDAKWEGATDAATRTWFAKYRPGQKYTDRCYSDDWKFAAGLVVRLGL